MPASHHSACHFWADIAPGIANARILSGWQSVLWGGRSDGEGGLLA